MQEAPTERDAHRLKGVSDRPLYETTSELTAKPFGISRRGVPLTARKRAGPEPELEWNRGQVMVVSRFIPGDYRDLAFIISPLEE